MEFEIDTQFIHVEKFPHVRIYMRVPGIETMIPHGIVEILSRAPIWFLEKYFTNCFASGRQIYYFSAIVLKMWLECYINDYNSRFAKWLVKYYDAKIEYDAFNQYININCVCKHHHPDHIHKRLWIGYHEKLKHIDNFIKYCESP